MIPLPERYAQVLQSFSGGMSDACLCVDANLTRNVLVKALQPGMDQTRIVDEIRALQEIRSPHVVQIYDVIRDTTGAVLGIVEEYLPGADLTEVARPTSINDALHLLYQMSSGISDIHDNERVHRDIKPNNMKFDAESCLKIFDFGLSKIDKGNAATKNISFTPGYAAPELFRRGASGDIAFTKAVDTFAFAASAYEYLTGSLPDELSHMPPTLPCADFRLTSLTLPTEVADLLNRCLDADPAQRPEMSDVRDNIARHLLRNRHKAIITYGASIHTITEAGKGVRVTAAPMGSVAVSYNGFRFRIAEATGEIYMNNTAVGVGSVLPGSCVITVGPPSAGNKRAIITVDVSHPEVTV